jgi:hypothetical protein
VIKKSSTYIFSGLFFTVNVLEPFHFPDSLGSMVINTNCYLYLIDAEDADGEDADGVEDHQLLTAPCSLKHCEVTVRQLFELFGNC